MRRLRVLAAVCGTVVALGVLAGSPVASATAGRAASTATVSTAKIASLGTVLVDTSGKTLYSLTNAGQAVPCTGVCASAWPPLQVAAGATVTDPKGMKGLGVAADGVSVTMKGLPLYRFAGDAQAGDAKGQGLSSFGGTWHVAKAKAKATAAKKKTSTTTKSSYGY